MDFDPLSKNARRARTSLMIASSSLLLAYALKIEIKEINGLGITLSSEPQLLYSILFISVLYFIACFLCYCSMDIYNKNLPFLSYYSEQRKKYNQFLNDVTLRIFRENFVRDFLSIHSTNRDPNWPYAIEQKIGAAIDASIKSYPDYWLTKNDRTKADFVTDMTRRIDDHTSEISSDAIRKKIEENLRLLKQI
ncbi:MAG: hypothetical protein ACR2RF_30050, partial [Geminicoccaceae bacterium]